MNARSIVAVACAAVALSSCEQTCNSSDLECLQAGLKLTQEGLEVRPLRVTSLPASAGVAPTRWTIGHWDGGAWTATYGPNEGSYAGLWGTRANDVWAAGAMRATASALHWGDGGWVAASPTGPQVFDVGGSSANDAWAVGAGGFISHWTGSSWSQVSSPVSVELRSVWVFDANTAWAVGAAGTLLRWSNSWSVVPSPSQSALFGVSGTGPNDVWAVGDGPTVMHYDGSRWALLPAPVGVRRLWAVHAVTPTEVWVAGEDGRSGAVLKWDGLAWQSSHTAAHPLYGVWVARSGEVWAVGDRGTALRLAGGSWAATTTDNGARLLTVWGMGPGDVWAAGELVPTGSGSVAPVIVSQPPVVMLTPKEPQPLPLVWGDPNGCTPSFCFRVCSPRVRCVTGYRCSRWIPDGQLQGTATFTVSYDVQVSTTADFELEVTPVTAPECPQKPEEEARAWEEGQLEVGPPVRIAQKLTPPRTGTGGGTGGAGGGTGGGSGGNCQCFCGWPANTRCTKNTDCPDDTSVPGTRVPGVCGKPVVCAQCDPL